MAITGIHFSDPENVRSLGLGAMGRSFLKLHIQNVLSTALKFPCLGPQNGFQVTFAPFRNSSYLWFFLPLI